MFPPDDKRVGKKTSGYSKDMFGDESSRESLDLAEERDSDKQLNHFLGNTGPYEHKGVDIEFSKAKNPFPKFYETDSEFSKNVDVLMHSPERVKDEVEFREPKKKIETMINENSDDSVDFLEENIEVPTGFIDFGSSESKSTENRENMPLLQEKEKPNFQPRQPSIRNEPYRPFRKQKNYNSSKALKATPRTIFHKALDAVNMNWENEHLRKIMASDNYTNSNSSHHKQPGEVSWKSNFNTIGQPFWHEPTNVVAARVDSLRSHGHNQAALRLSVSFVRTMKQIQADAQAIWNKYKLFKNSKSNNKREYNVMTDTGSLYCSSCNPSEKFGISENNYMKKPCQQFCTKKVKIGNSSNVSLSQNSSKNICNQSADSDQNYQKPPIFANNQRKHLLYKKLTNDRKVSCR
jgi:hypothetical protein